MAAGQGSEELVAESTAVLLNEILEQSHDVVAPSEIRDLAEALSLLAPLIRSAPARPRAA
jgi:hypothetical protein